MNSVVSFLSSFVFGLHLVMNPWRLGDIVQVSFCFICVCVWQVCLQFPKGFFFFLFLNPEEYKLRRGRRKQEGEVFQYFEDRRWPHNTGSCCFCFSFQRGRRDGWYQFHQMWVFTEPPRVPPGGVTLWKIKCPSNQEEAGTVSVPFHPCFFEKH